MMMMMMMMMMISNLKPLTTQTNHKLWDQSLLQAMGSVPVTSYGISPYHNQRYIWSNITLIRSEIFLGSENKTSETSAS